MEPLVPAYDTVLNFLDDLAFRIVAETGIPSDRYHLGKIIFQSLKDAPDFVLQIDGSTEKSESFKSALERTVQCATSFKNLGLKTGDVIVLMAPNYIDVCIPFYAALYMGVSVAPVDFYLGWDELQGVFSNTRPKILFCENHKVSLIEKALSNCNISGYTIVAFDKGSNAMTFTDFLKKYGDNTDVMDFKPADFDAETTIAFLATTSGTTGVPKSAALTHKNMTFAVPRLWLNFTKYPTPTELALVAAPLQWLSNVIIILYSPVLRYTRLQYPGSITQDIFEELLRKYKPTYTAVSPTLMTTLTKPGMREKCDLTCFRAIIIGGSTVHKELVEEVKKATNGANVYPAYGLTEVAGPSFHYSESTPCESVGRLLGFLALRLTDIETGEDILEPHVNGELWLRGPSVCQGYYNNPEATAEAFKDGWFKSGDVFYRDEHCNFFFVERLKLLLKYKSYQISPVELEAVIRRHPGILDVAVIGIPDPECGDLPVACVVPRLGHSLTAQEIKDLVKDSLAESKQLRGGVIFMTELPMTASTKVHRRLLKEIVLTLPRE